MVVGQCHKINKINEIKRSLYFLETSFVLEVMSTINENS